MSKLFTVTLGMILATTNGMKIHQSSLIKQKLRSKVGDENGHCVVEGIRRIIFSDTECKFVDHEKMSEAGFEISE